MENLIRVESANMKYDDSYNIESVEIEYRYEGKIMRHGRGEIELDHETFVNEADVKKLEQRIIGELIKELENAQIKSDEE